MKGTAGAHAGAGNAPGAGFVQEVSFVSPGKALPFPTTWLLSGLS